jgi:hypothetical protein
MLPIPPRPAGWSLIFISRDKATPARFPDVALSRLGYHPII